MGMLMHHTWLNQQKKADKPAEKKPVEKPVEESTEPEATKKTGGRRKSK